MFAINKTDVSGTALLIAAGKGGVKIVDLILRDSRAQPDLSDHLRAESDIVKVCVHKYADRDHLLLIFPWWADVEEWLMFDAGGLYAP